jgi:hypothetical protein
LGVVTTSRFAAARRSQQAMLFDVFDLGPAIKEALPGMPSCQVGLRFDDGAGGFSVSRGAFAARSEAAAVAG